MRIKWCMQQAVRSGAPLTVGVMTRMRELSRRWWRKGTVSGQRDSSPVDHRAVDGQDYCTPSPVIFWTVHPLSTERSTGRETVREAFPRPDTICCSVHLLSTGRSIGRAMDRQAFQKDDITVKKFHSALQKSDAALTCVQPMLDIAVFPSAILGAGCHCPALNVEAVRTHRRRRRK